jgi:hypothetical protein
MVLDSETNEVFPLLEGKGSVYSHGVEGLLRFIPPGHESAANIHLPKASITMIWKFDRTGKPSIKPTKDIFRVL